MIRRTCGPIRAMNVAAVVAATLTLGHVRPGAAMTIVSIGDSVAQGVQSADAQAATQRQSFPAIFARKAGEAFVLPLIRGNAYSTVAAVAGRSRTDANARGHNLGVSDATVADALWLRADALSEEEIDSEVDLVLFPRTGSQMEVAESMAPDLILCWLGNNDALSSITSFDQLDASQLTPLAEFRDDYHTLVQRLAATGAKVVLGDIPDLTGIGFLFGPEDLIRFTGSDQGLPEGSYTSQVAALLLRLGLAERSLLTDPDWVLDAQEAASIQQRIDEFNAVIREEAAAAGFALASVRQVLGDLAAEPFTFAGVRFRRGFLGGSVSLDGIHPTNLAHHVIAGVFIDAANETYDLDISQINLLDVLLALYLDPNIDKDGDLQVVGRRRGGLLETLAVPLGVSGDPDDSVFSPPRAGRLTREQVESAFRTLH
jgi:lysophospholipase L1-like esterase